MEIIKKKIPWLIKLAAKLFLKWLIRQLEEELQEGIRLKVRIDGKDYDLIVKLTTHRDINTPYLIID